MTDRADIVVIGGGPAGAAAATRLAEAGREVVVLERAPGPHHKVCGEFVSADALAALASLGVDARALGAVPIDRVAVTAGSLVAEAALPFVAVGLSRRALDAALLARAAAAGAEVRPGVQVKAGQGARVVLADGSAVRAEHVLVATGKHDLKGTHRGTPWRGRGGMLGLKMHFALGAAALARLWRRIELHLLPGACAGLQRVEGAANLCVTLTAAAYARAGGRFDGLLRWMAASNAALAAALEGAEPAWPRPLAIARVPYGHLLPPQAAGDGWRLGDQAAVTPSFTGDGLAIALESGMLAAEHILAGRPQAAYAAAIHARARRQMRPAMRLQALVDRPALHRLGVAVARLEPRLLSYLARATRLD